MRLLPILRHAFPGFAMSSGLLLATLAVVSVYVATDYEFPGVTEVAPFQAPNTCADLPLRLRYFPDAAFSYDDFHSNEGYAALLQSMNEPSLYCGPEQNAIRLLWLRSFHGAVAIRVNLNDAGSELIAVEMEVPDEFGPGVERYRKSRQLSDPEFAQLRTAMDSARLSRLGVEQEQYGLDGSTWIIELRKGRHYRGISRWSPKKGGVRSIGLLLIHLADLPKPPSDRY